MITNHAQTPEYLVVKEAAALLRVSPSSIYKAVSAGSLPAVRLSERGAIRIPASALEAKEN